MQINSSRPFVSILNKKINGQEYKLDNFVTAIDTDTSLDIPSGTFQIEIVPRHSEELQITYVNQIPFWLKTLKKNDIVSIGFGKSGDVMIGKIDAIATTKRTGRDSYSRSIKIAGRDIGSILVDDDIVFAPELSTNKKAIELLGRQRTNFLGITRGLFQGQSTFINRPVLEAIMWIMWNMPSVHLNIIYENYEIENPKTGKFNVSDRKVDKLGKFFQFDLMQYKVDTVFDPNLTQYSGKVWNYILQCVDRMFYEVFVDTKIVDGEPRPCLFVRPRPFDEDYFIPKDDYIVKAELEDFKFEEKENQTLVTLDIDKLKPVRFKWDLVTVIGTFTEDDPEGENLDSSKENHYKTMITGEDFHTINEDEVFQENIVTSINNVVNFITMHPSKDVLSNTPLARYGYLFPIMDVDSVKRYGIRRIDGITNLFKMPNEQIKQTDDRADNIETKEGKDYLIYGANINYVQRRNQLFYWNVCNPIYHEGIKVIYGSSSIRKGDKVFFPDEISQEGERGVYYYTAGVGHRYTSDISGTKWLSVLQLARGYNEDAKFRFLQSKQLDESLLKIDVFASENTSSGNTGKEDKESTIDYRDTNLHSRSDGIDGNGKYTIRKSAISDFKEQYETYKNRFIRYEYNSKGYPIGEINVSKESVIKHLKYVASNWNINPNILMALIIRESSWNPRAKSSANAIGLGQHMGGTDRRKFFGPSISGWKKTPLKKDARYDVIKNITAIARHLVEDKRWGESLKSKIRALNRYWGEDSTSSKAYYMNFLKPKIKEYLPETQLYDF